MAKTERPDDKLRRAGFQIAERKTGKEPMWKKRQRPGESKLFTQSEAEAIVDKVMEFRGKVK